MATTEPDRIEALLVEATALFGQLRGEDSPLTKLFRLFRELPDDAGELARLSAGVYRLLDIDPAAPDDQKRAAAAGLGARIDGASDAGPTLARVVDALVERAEEIAARDAGTPDDPVIRASTLRNRVAREGASCIGVAEREWFGPDYWPALSGAEFGAGVRFARHDALPKAHPLRAIDPYPAQQGPVVVLGAADAPRGWHRLSEARELTAGLHAARAVRVERERKEAERKAEEERRAFLETPAGQRQRLAELEAKLAALAGERT